jgi:metal-responsive CopG/Arc/MetJ family transcriptional regulator
MPRNPVAAKKRVIVSVTLPPDIVRWLDAEARRDDRSRSKIVEHLIRQQQDTKPATRKAA